MNYLYFDIECARCDKGGVGFICEFGYILCDEKFEEIEQNHFMINPDTSFDEWALKNILQYPKEEYAKHPLFLNFYEKIKNLLMNENQIVVGHSTSADLKYIASECKRYNLPKIYCKGFDIREPFKVLQSKQNFTKLEKMVEELKINGLESLHNARVDAIATMLVCKTLCKNYNKTISELLSIKAPKSENRNYKETTCGSTLGEQLRAKGYDLSKLF